MSNMCVWCYQSPASGHLASCARYRGVTPDADTPRTDPPCYRHGTLYRNRRIALAIALSVILFCLALAFTQLISKVF